MNGLPVVVVGAGPIGLAAAAHLAERGLTPLVLEAGETAGAAVAQWGHVRLFSPWSELVDPAAVRLLAQTGWQPPDPRVHPSGAQWQAGYLRPLAAALAGRVPDRVPGRVRFGARVIGVARRGRDRVVDAGRDSEPLTVHVTTASGEERITARAVVDASGTWGQPNPLGGDGLPALGEAAAAAAGRITYRIPDLADPRARARYAGRRTAVAGSGHSALTTLTALAALAEEHPGTEVVWVLRRGLTDQVFGGGEFDQLPARGALGQRAKLAAEARQVTTVTGFRTAAVDRAADGRLVLESMDGHRLEAADEVVALAGFRPELSWLSEVRLDLDPVLQAPRALAPLIDPNIHSCGTVPPHGVAELAQPEPGVFVVGMKSYGRAPTFLALTGYEQVRSVAAEIAGDYQAARRVELCLPETGVCGGAGGLAQPAALGLEPAVGAGGCCAPAGPVEVALLPAGQRLEPLSR